MHSTSLVQILDKSASLRANDPVNCMNPSHSPPTTGKILGQTRFSNLGRRRKITCLSRNIDCGGGRLRGVVVNEVDCESLQSKFEFQLHYYVLFRTNTCEKGTNPTLWVK